ncbi:MAG TPA: hypothetical protein VD794_11950 [Flavisolibacter sp.]|nr:hypothetical protein [Flavisolibacter sp.]
MGEIKPSPELEIVTRLYLKACFQSMLEDIEEQRLDREGIVQYVKDFMEELDTELLLSRFKLILKEPK